jgi:hypothetical protein
MGRISPVEATSVTSNETSVLAPENLRARVFGGLSPTKGGEKVKLSPFEGMEMLGIATVTSGSEIMCVLGKTDIEPGVQ